MVEDNKLDWMVAKVAETTAGATASSSDSTEASNVDATMVNCNRCKELVNKATCKPLSRGKNLNDLWTCKPCNAAIVRLYQLEEGFQMDAVNALSEEEKYSFIKTLKESKAKRITRSL